MEPAKYELFTQIPEKEPIHFKRIDWACVQCCVEYHFYLSVDGDVCFTCPQCGLYQELAGPWAIWN